MGRRKIEMAFIDDERKRASTFEKRRIGLFKKASELNRLCGVNIAVIIINKDSLYRFSDMPNKFFKNYLNERVEKSGEDFNSDTLMEFINRKVQKMINTTDSNSIDHQSNSEERNNVFTDDEEDPRFVETLLKHKLLDSYKNINTELTKNPKESPERIPGSRENTDQSIIVSNGSVNSSTPVSFNYTNDENHINSYTTPFPFPPINEIGMNGQHRYDNDLSSFCKGDLFYSELRPMSSLNSGFSFNAQSSMMVNSDINDSIMNSNWLTHSSNNPMHSQLHFEMNSDYNNISNSLETPIFDLCNGNNLQHLENSLPSCFHNQEIAKAKRLKISVDSQEPSYSL